MIEKSRLEELIEKEEFIYRPTLFGIKKIKTNKHWIVLNGGVYKGKNVTRTFWLNEVFETKEDAEEYAEFGNITRTDTLKFSIWEDIKDKGYDEIFFVKDNRFDSGVVQYYFLVAEQTKEIQIMFREIDHLMIITAYDVIFNKPLTRENYNEARRLCVKLFKGEDV